MQDYTPPLTSDERAALAFLLRTATKYGPEKCWPTVYSIGVAIGRKPRSVSRILTALAAFGIIERAERGPASSKYAILLTAEQLAGILGVAFRKDGVAFGVACEKAAQPQEIRAVKPKKSHAIGVASPSLCPPTPQPTRYENMEMPYYYREPNDQKLWRMASRWIRINKPDLGAYSMDMAAPIMELLERAGALELAEDAPLPAIQWPPADLPRYGKHPDSKQPRMATRLVELSRKLGT